MLTNFIRRFKENDRILKQEVVRASGDTAQRTTNWRAAGFWALVVAAAILLYIFIGRK